MLRRGLVAGFEDLDDDHASAAGRTYELVLPRLIGDLGSFDIGRRPVVLSSEKAACESDIVGTVAIGEQAVMANAVEAFGEDVDQEAPDELMDRQGHGLVALWLLSSIILPGEGDVFVVDADEPTVGDGDPMGIAGEVVEHRVWSGEGFLGVDCKVGFVEGLEIDMESAPVSKRLMIIEELETTVDMGLF